MRVGIIGAGALGLFLACKIEKLNIDYMIFNAGKVGRKILASGNGRCNIAHKDYSKESYFDNALALDVLEHNALSVFEFFKELNIYTKCDDEGRMYPLSESSQSVLNIFMKNIKKKVTDLEITSIIKNKNHYYFNDCYGPFDKVVIATGSIASFKRPYLSMDYLNKLNLKFNPFIPSLVGFTTTRKIKLMSGARSKCKATLLQNHKVIYEESGEVIFKDNGISGIVILNLSAYYAHLESKADCAVELDLAPGIEVSDYTTVLQPKVLEYIEANHLNPHKLLLPISGVYDYEFAQVCHGGIDTSEVNSNLSLKKDNNIFVGGEILDVDGLCGGYNLLFAFASAMAIAKELEYEVSAK